jgi:hypothetical protein
MSESRTSFDELAEQMAVLPHGSRGQMFGMPVVKVKSKAFMGFFQEEIVFKLDGISLQEALALPGAHRFDPMGSGRAMREWIQIPFDHGALWGKMAVQARAYVLQLTEK